MDREQNTESWIRLGRVVRAHGIKGGLSVKLDNPLSTTIKRSLKIRLEMPSSKVSEHNVVAFQAGRILYVEDICDRNSAEAMQKAQVLIKREDLPKLEEGWDYLGDLIGFEVFDRQKNLLGVVEGFSDNTAQTLVVVRLLNKKEGLIPFVNEIVVDVDHDSSSIHVDLPDGLLDIE